MEMKILGIIAAIISLMMVLVIFLPSIQKIVYKNTGISKDAFSDRVKGDILEIIYSGRLEKKDVLLKSADGSKLKLIFFLKNKKLKTETFSGNIKPYQITIAQIPEDAIGYVLYYDTTRILERTLVN